jgi:hypothetical protein
MFQLKRNRRVAVPVEAGAPAYLAISPIPLIPRGSNLLGVADKHDFEIGNICVRRNQIVAERRSVIPMQAGR